jgi:hypothetical protein
MAWDLKNSSIGDPFFFILGIYCILIGFLSFQLLAFGSGHCIYSQTFFVPLFDAGFWFF